MANPTSANDQSISGRETLAIEPSSWREGSGRAGLRTENELAIIALLCYVAGLLCLIATAGYMVIRVLNARLMLGHPHSLAFALLAEARRLMRDVGLSDVPGLPDERSIWYFSNRTFADDYLVVVALVHLVAASAFFALGYAVRRHNTWARWCLVILSVIALPSLAAYAVVYATTDAPKAGLAVVAALAIVPAWIGYALTTPAMASAFSSRDRNLIPPGRRPFLARFLLGLLMGMFGSGGLIVLFWVSISVAIFLQRLILMN